ncbi:venom dipeptidyl peptidase 4 isoform X2 [Condylostylus longicornis]|uniref:venom dipeptidyl peptidase 4 isoform X2 n=1 Tax=Condylostylus longicornis TaxID=2530218 RepID=UPI00244E12EF|nr:venom dipeptidyl peptidase 4 isoform X2 [Condylostylus longicornis]XP_055384087.1 venom dipeptidyl peptidase 4 isoform X2 [Condylostylus longicornis]XP_055384088.1 venom dipeptidyl peptidase 4 isoform X2 [Condylostylus longicornis]XP_055384089.1 venom dipeptidyl peptidase 4 isoform X2 [Condylostylus longicornis]
MKHNIKMTGGNNGTVENAQNSQGLVYSTRKIRNIRIILSIISVIVIGALISVAVILLVNASTDGLPDEKDTRVKLSLNDILVGKFSTRKQNMTWSGCDTVSFVEGNKVVELNVLTNSKKVLMEVNRIRDVLTKSADGKYLLIAEESYKLFRHSFVAKYYVLDLETKILTPIKIKENHERLALVKWGPTGNSLIINYFGNLYYKKTPLDAEIQLTDDDPEKRILNGIPDWVYEEEVFSSNEAVWFNPNGTKIAYIRFDDSPTFVMNIQLYGEPGDIRYQYPINKHVSYPKSGTPNPLVSLKTIDLEMVLENSAIVEEAISPVPVPSALNTQEHIITSVEWLNNEVLYSVFMNRIQNDAHLQVLTTKKRHETYNIKSETGWVDLFSSPLINRDGSQIALILPHNQGGQDGDYRHLSLLSTTGSYQKPYPLTTGKYVVQSLLKWDHDNNIIFYMANTPEKSQSLHLYAIKASSSKRNTGKPQCLTCNLIKYNEIEQTYFSVDFSPCGKNIIITSLGPNPPSVHIFQWSYSGGNVNLKKLYDWETNDRIRTSLQNVALPTTKILTIDVDDGFTAKVQLQLPPNLDHSKKYPMLIEVYGGPDSYAVTDKWSLDWGSYLASNRSIIYARIDGRGSGLRGDKLAHSIYKKLGTVEVYDQINVASKLHQNLSYIDSAHVGIWGWSYGGYASGRALALDDNNIFQCATSVAPVTDWLYYDSIYTERYLQRPNENMDGYEKSRLTNLAKSFENKKYLIVHGTFDDNVHYQQSLMLIKSLERANILFKQISYPDEDHSLGSMRPHLYHSLDRFFGACFGLETNKYFR